MPEEQIRRVRLYSGFFRRIRGSFCPGIVRTGRGLVCVGADSREHGECQSSLGNFNEAPILIHRPRPQFLVSDVFGEIEERRQIPF